MKTINAKLCAFLCVGFGAVTPAWAQMPIDEPEKLINALIGLVELIPAMEQAQAARELQFIIAGALLVFIANVLCVWLAGRAESTRGRTLWLRELVFQWALVAIAFALTRFDVVSVESAVIGCVLGILARLYLGHRRGVQEAAVN